MMMKLIWLMMEPENLTRMGSHSNLSKRSAESNYCGRCKNMHDDLFRFVCSSSV